MLNFFRRRDMTARIVLGGFLVIICVAMVMFLIPQGMSGDSSLPVSQQAVATVNGNTITGLDLTSALQRYAQGQQIPPQLMPVLGQSVLRQLVMEQALADQANRLGFAPTNTEIAAAARQQIPQLYPGGKYVGDAQAAQMLAPMQLSLPQVQQQLRQNLMVQKVQDLITDPVRVSASAVREQFERQNESAKVQYVLLDPNTLQAQVKVTPAALAAYYKLHQSTYQAPEKRQIEVLLANQAAIASGIRISPAAVDQFYKQNLDTYTHPEQVQASHILIKYPSASPSATEIAATRTRAETVLKQVDAKPADFAALAKKYSQDDATASKGGELGFIQRNQTVPNVEKVAFGLPVGKISGLVQTAYGFEILKVEAHNQAYVQSEASVHDQIVAGLQKDQAVDTAQNLMNRAAGMAQSTPLAQVAKQLKLEYFATQPLSRTDPITGIGVNPNFAGAVFSTQAGGVTPPVQVAQGFALAKVTKIVPPGPQPLSAVADQVTADYKKDQAQSMATAQAKALEAAAKKQGLKAAAAGLHLPLKTSQALTRAGSLPGAGAISSFADTLFALKPGAVGPVAQVAGNQVVYSLVALTQPTDAEFAQQKDSIKQTLLTQKRNSVFAAYTDSLMAQLTKGGKITINQAAMQRALGGGSNAPSSPTAPATPRGLGLG